MSEKDYRVCVYTVLTGDYEALNEQHVCNESKIDFICITDSLDLVSDTWIIRRVDPFYPFDKRRSQRHIKICAHLYLGDYDASLYIDNSVLLKKAPDFFIRECIESKKLMSLSYHGFRDTLIDEFFAVSLHSYDSQFRILEQILDYWENAKEVFEEKPFWTGIIFRLHTNQDMCIFSEIWFSHVSRYSARDQLSINMALFQSKIDINVLEINNNDSALHSWPVVKGRSILSNVIDLHTEIRISKIIRSIIFDIKSKNQKPPLDSSTEFSNKINVLKNPHVIGGTNRSGDGGELSFGIEEFPNFEPMARIAGSLVNNFDKELQGELLIQTRPYGAVSQKMQTRLVIKSNGCIQIIPCFISPKCENPGDMYFDGVANNLRISLDGKNWSNIVTEVI